MIVAITRLSQLGACVPRGALNEKPRAVAGAGFGSQRWQRAYSPSALATNGGLINAPVCSGAV